MNTITASIEVTNMKDLNILKPLIDHDIQNSAQLDEFIMIVNSDDSFESKFKNVEKLVRSIRN
tara:strand:- start:2895 stop:3083 length:189 start_codon:yes stop_codon:yes gene_type:complete